MSVGSNGHARCALTVPPVYGSPTHNAMTVLVCRPEKRASKSRDAATAGLPLRRTAKFAAADLVRNTGHACPIQCTLAVVELDAILPPPAHVHHCAAVMSNKSNRRQCTKRRTQVRAGLVAAESARGGCVCVGGGGGSTALWHLLLTWSFLARDAQVQRRPISPPRRSGPPGTRGPSGSSSSRGGGGK